MSTRKRSVKTVGRTGRGRERLPAELSQANLERVGNRRGGQQSLRGGVPRPFGDSLDWFEAPEQLLSK